MIVLIADGACQRQGAWGHLPGWVCVHLEEPADGRVWSGLSPGNACRRSHLSEHSACLCSPTPPLIKVCVSGRFVMCACGFWRKGGRHSQNLTAWRNGGVWSGGQWCMPPCPLKTQELSRSFWRSVWYLYSWYYKNVTAIYNVYIIYYNNL